MGSPFDRLRVRMRPANAALPYASEPLFRYLIVALGDFEQAALGARLIHKLGESACLLASLAPFFSVWLKPR
jgi:hypothetical protein